MNSLKFIAHELPPIYSILASEPAQLKMEHVGVVAFFNHEVIVRLSVLVYNE